MVPLNAVRVLIYAFTMIPPSNLPTYHRIHLRVLLICHCDLQAVVGEAQSAAFWRAFVERGASATSYSQQGELLVDLCKVGQCGSTEVNAGQ